MDHKRDVVGVALQGGMSRRQFGQCVGASALTLAPVSAAAFSNELDATLSSVMAVADSRLPGATNFAAKMQVGGVGVALFTGDVTGVWRDRLRTFWAKGRGTVLGLTQADTLFWLSLMAADHGHRLVYDIDLATGDDPVLPHPFPSRPVELKNLPCRGASVTRFWAITHRSNLA